MRRPVLKESNQIMNSTSPTVTPSRVNMTTAARELTQRTYPPMNHIQKAGELQSNRAARAIGSATATAQVFAFGIDLESWSELLQMQDAAWQRLRTLQQSWLQYWNRWLVYSDGIKGANTMSKLVEREGNIGAQLTQLVGNQITGLVGLQENIEVDYSYWISEKLNEKRKSVAISAASK